MAKTIARRMDTAARAGPLGQDSAKPTPAWYRSPILAVVTLLAVWRLALAFVLPYDRFIALFDDDAFYYFGVARHIAQGSGSTFNGIDPTNGYHPAWLLIIEPVFSLSQGRAALIGVTVVSCLLFVAFGAILEQISRVVGGASIVLVSAAPILTVSVVGPSYFFSGMETGLAVVGLSAVGLFFLRTSGFSQAAATPRNAAILGLLMTLSIAARLDTVITMTLVGLVALWRWRTKIVVALQIAVIPTIFLVAYAAFNLASFGTPTPVSGQAKALGDATNMGVFAQLLAAPRIFGLNSYLGLVAAPVTVAAVVIAVRRPARGHVESAVFGGVLYLGSWCTMTYFGLTSSWQLWPWYFYAIPVSLLFTLVPLVNHLARAATVLAVLSATSVLALTSVWTVEQVASADSRSAFVAAAPEVASMIDRLDPPDSPIAIGDRAGSIGYHLGRPTVQLEGLVDSEKYLDALQKGGVGPYLNERGVRFYARVDSAEGQSAMGPEGLRRFSEPQQGYGPKADIFVRDDDLLFSFPLPDGTSYRVWRYRPELNSG
jgi:hypothetical protein